MLETKPKFKTCHTSDLYDASLLQVHDHVISRITGKLGIVTEIKTIEAHKYPPTDLIVVRWEDGSVGHPYANQLAKIFSLPS